MVLYSREVVSLQRSESIAQALLGHEQVVFIEGGPWIQVAGFTVYNIVCCSSFHVHVYTPCMYIVCVLFHRPEGKGVSTLNDLLGRET